MKEIFMVLMVIYLPLAISAQDSKAGKNQEQEIISTLTEMWAAIENEDIERYAGFIHPDFSAFGENDTYLAEGKELEIRSIRSWLESADKVHTEMHNPQVTIIDNVAWIVYYWTDSGISNGKSFATKGKSTRIFVLENQKWLCIHGHYTLVP